MGKIKIEGKAEKYFKTDMIEMTIIFKKSDVLKADAINNLLAECEAFLSKLKNAGFNMENVTIESENSKYHLLKELKHYDVEKRIVLKFRADLKLSNTLIKLLQLEDYEAEYTLSFLFADKAELQKQLLLEAIENSKNKADMIASSMNMKIIGIEEIKSPYGYRSLAKSICVESFDDKLEDLLSGHSTIDTSTSDMLNTPQKELSETVEVIWLTE